MLHHTHAMKQLCQNQAMNLYIVEDSIHIQVRLKRLVEQLPELHVIGMAGDLATASKSIFEIDSAAEQEDKLQAIIMDIQLRDGNSLNLLKTIKHEKPQIKVVIFSNHATEANRLYAMRAGADGFLDKSTDFDQLPSLLQHWLYNSYSATSIKAR